LSHERNLDEKITYFLRYQGLREDRMGLTMGERQSLVREKAAAVHHVIKEWMDANPTYIHL